MKGKVFAFDDPNSTSAYLIPSTNIPEEGYSMKPGECFKDVVVTGGHEQTIVQRPTFVLLLVKNARSDRAR